VVVQAAGAPPADMAALELHLVALLCDATAADLASGHTELAVARLQAALEYNCFAPPIFGVHVGSESLGVGPPVDLLHAVLAYLCCGAPGMLDLCGRYLAPILISLMVVLPCCSQ
jgi:hypothetical protein